MSDFVSKKPSSHKCQITLDHVDKIIRGLHTLPCHDMVISLFPRMLMPYHGMAKASPTCNFAFAMGKVAWHHAKNVTHV